MGRRAVIGLIGKSGQTTLTEEAIFVSFASVPHGVEDLPHDHAGLRVKRRIVRPSAPPRSRKDLTLIPGEANTAQKLLESSVRPQ